MKIKRWDLPDETVGTEKGIMVSVTTQEAMMIIRSLSNQILNETCNAGRSEMFDHETGEYFSVAVDDNANG